MHLFSLILHIRLQFNNTVYHALVSINTAYYPSAVKTIVHQALKKFKTVPCHAFFQFSTRSSFAQYTSTS